MEGSDRQDFVDAMIGEYQARLGLRDWDVRYLEGEKPSGAPGEHAADCHIFHMKQAAVIRIDPRIVNEHVLRREVLHELLHIITAKIEWAYSAVVREYVPKAVRKEVKLEAEHFEEWAIERLTKAFMGAWVAPAPEGDIWQRAFPSWGPDVIPG